MPPTVPVPKPGPCPGTKRLPRLLKRAVRSVEATPGQRLRPVQRRAEVRTSLMLAETITEVNQIAATKARELSGRPVLFDLGGTDVQIAREHAEGILQGLERFPKARLYRVATFDSRQGPLNGEDLSNAFAVTITGAYGSSILFNSRYIDDPADYRLELARSRGHLTAPTPIGIAWHEFGHVMGADTMAATASKKIARSLAASAGSKPSAFVQDQVSLYAKKDDHELLAEGFADVMAREEEAAQVSQEIFAEVSRRYAHNQNPGGRR